MVMVVVVVVVVVVVGGRGWWYRPTSAVSIRGFLARLADIFDKCVIKSSADLEMR